MSLKGMEAMPTIPMVRVTIIRIFNTGHPDNGYLRKTMIIVVQLEGHTTFMETMISL